MEKRAGIPRQLSQARAGSSSPGAWRGLLKLLLRPWLLQRSKHIAERALQHGLADLGIDWPVEILWDKDLPYLGLVKGSNQHCIQMRPDQVPKEATLTVFHEVYHLAQLHKWGDLSPTIGENSRGDLERAESLAEIYSRITLRELKNPRKKKG